MCKYTYFTCICGKRTFGTWPSIGIPSKVKNTTAFNMIFLIFKLFMCIPYRIDPVAFPNNDGFKKITITYEDHCFIICMSNKKIHVVKKSLNNSLEQENNTINV